MGKEDVFEMEGKVIEVLPNTKFKVAVGVGNDNKMIVTADLAGRLKMNNIRILLGDTVTLDVSVYDNKKGRITWRK